MRGVIFTYTSIRLSELFGHSPNITDLFFKFNGIYQQISANIRTTEKKQKLFSDKLELVRHETCYRDYGGTLLACCLCTVNFITLTLYYASVLKRQIH